MAGQSGNLLMMKQVWRWISLLPLLHPVWFNIILLVLAWSIVGVAYQSNDDLVIASVLDGWGDPSYADAHVIFVNPLLTRFLLMIAPVLGGLSVWPVFLAVATLSSGAAIFTMLTAHARKARSYDFTTLVLLLVWLLIMPGFYAALQFSHAAFLVGFTGVLTCLKHGSSSRWKLVAGVFLCVLGSMIRLDAALVCDAFFGAVLAAGSMDGFRPSWEKLRSRGRLWGALACVFAFSYGLNGYNRHAHRSVFEGCDVAAWNEARALLSDTSPIRSEDEYECASYGVFANDIKMVQMFTNCDMEVFNTDYLRRLRLARDGNDFWPRMWIRGEKALHLFSWDSIVDLLPCWILFGLACRASFRRGDSPALLCCVGGLLVLVLLYMASIDRLYFRVVYPTFLIAGLCLLRPEHFQAVRVKWTGKGALTGSLPMFCAFAVSLSQACAAVWEANMESFSPEAGRLLCERVDREPDSLFCVQMSGGTIDDLAPGQSVFRKAWSCSRKNVVTLGGWNFPLKPVQKKLQEMGWNGQTALHLCRDNVYIVCLTPQGDLSDMDRKFFTMLCRHIWEHHGIRTAWHLDENIEGVRIYRLRKTWFQPGRDGRERPPVL